MVQYQRTVWEQEIMCHRDVPHSCPTRGISRIVDLAIVIDLLLLTIVLTDFDGLVGWLSIIWVYFSPVWLITSLNRSIHGLIYFVFAEPLAKFVKPEKRSNTTIAIAQKYKNKSILYSEECDCNGGNGNETPPPGRTHRRSTADFNCSGQAKYMLI